MAAEEWRRVALSETPGQRRKEDMSQKAHCRIAIPDWYSRGNVCVASCVFASP
jgi:hypothetical protein